MSVRLAVTAFFALLVAPPAPPAVAADFVYAWPRVVDPRVRSPNSDLLEHKIVKLDAAVEIG